MEARIQAEHPQADVGLIRGGGGVFDVTVDDELLFSKHQAGRFPEESEILEAIATR